MLVDDHPFVRAGVNGVLSSAGDIEVVGECDDGTQVPQTAASVLPHVVLMDVRMPAKSGMEATRELLASQPGVRVVMLTGALTGAACTRRYSRARSATCSRAAPRTSW